MHGPSAWPARRHRQGLRVAALACLLCVALAALGACSRESGGDAAPALPAADAAQASTPPPAQAAQAASAADAPAALPVPQPPVVDESAPPQPRLTGIALADATAAAGPMAAGTRPLTTIATPMPIASGKLDDRCASDADCGVKDVGSCCGYYPQCLNHDSPTDAASVKSRCASEGRVGICGFPAIAGCQCVQGRCAAMLQTDEGRVR